MAMVQGIREKLQWPLYDSLLIDKEAQLRDTESSSTLKFFVNVQGKTKLETNLQSASLLPHYNTFEARAMRIVISDLPPVFPSDVTQEETDLDVLDGDGSNVNSAGGKVAPIDPKRLVADIDIPLDRVVELLKDARDSSDGSTSVDLDDDGKIVTSVRTFDSSKVLVKSEISSLVDLGITIDLAESDLQGFLTDFDEKDQPLDEQVDSTSPGNLIGKIIYNTVATLYVGEKIMIQMPTWFFPGGAGPFSETASITTHGTPSPQDTFRFAEPIFIDKQQNFRVEIEVPDSDTLKELQRIYGPMNIWVVLDGYMTRDVQ